MAEERLNVKVSIEEEGDQFVLVVEFPTKPTIRTRPMSKAEADAKFAEMTSMTKAMVTAAEPPDGYRRASS